MGKIKDIFPKQKFIQFSKVKNKKTEKILRGSKRKCCLEKMPRNFALLCAHGVDMA
jgi:hypothetical protein